jgi:hypothetical protein
MVLTEEEARRIAATSPSCQLYSAGLLKVHMGGKSNQVDAALAVAGWLGLVWWMLQDPILG